MKLLMHICCGPCTIFPLKELRTQGHEVVGAFYNPNIHPYCLQLFLLCRRDHQQSYTCGNGVSGGNAVG